MGATTESDRRRLIVDEAIALCLDADFYLQAALTKLVQRARTQEEVAIIQDLVEARRQVRGAHAQILQLHPDRLAIVGSKEAQHG